MSSIISSGENLIASIFEVIQSAVAVVFSTLESVTAVFTNLVQSIFDLLSGLVGFVLGNIVIIGVLLAAFVGYSAYRQKHQGGGVTAGKKQA